MHWFFKNDLSEFRDSIINIAEKVSLDISSIGGRSALPGTLGDEHTECQHIFTKFYTLLSERQSILSQQLLDCSTFPDPVVELRYYRSKARRSQRSEQPQFVERETGADFALAISVNIPGYLQTQRSVLGQGKVVHWDKSTRIDVRQLNTLLAVSGSESAAYLLWGLLVPPTFLTAENIAATLDSQKTNVFPYEAVRLGKRFGEFFCDELIGLWFGRVYKEDRDDPAPSGSIGVLYQLLHQGVPPPNVVYVGISTAGEQNVPPGLYVTERQDIP